MSDRTTGLGLDGDSLRALVRETLRDVLPTVLAGPSQPPVEDRVTLRDDTDLAAFVARVVALADDPATAQDLRAGRIRFSLDRSAGTDVAPAGRTDHRVGTGAVLERHVRAAAADGARIVVAPRVVVTPLARDRARASGVEIVREPSSSVNGSGGR